MSVRIRKVGNSDVITVPKELKLDRNVEYEAFVGRHGSITYLPVEKNPFEDTESIKKYGRADGSKMAGFVDAEVDDNEIEIH